MWAEVDHFDKVGNMRMLTVQEEMINGSNFSCKANIYTIQSALSINEHHESKLRHLISSYHHFARIYPVCTFMTSVSNGRNRQYTRNAC